MPTGTITALQIQERDKERVNVFIDGAFALGISLRTLQQLFLYKGKVIDEVTWQELVKAEALDKAYAAALAFLAPRPRSLREVADRLRQREFPQDHIDATLTRLAQLGLVDDLAFARFWIENRQAHRPRSARALSSELYQKGVPQDIIAAALDELASDDTETDAAIAVARQAARRYASAPDKMTFSRKLGAFLGRRGYAFTTIRPIVDTLWDELGSGKDDLGDDG